MQLLLLFVCLMGASARGKHDLFLGDNGFGNNGLDNGLHLGVAPLLTVLAPTSIALPPTQIVIAPTPIALPPTIIVHPPTPIALPPTSVVIHPPTPVIHSPTPSVLPVPGGGTSFLGGLSLIQMWALGKLIHNHQQSQNNDYDYDLPVRRPRHNVPHMHPVTSSTTTTTTTSPMCRIGAPLLDHSGSVVYCGPPVQGTSQFYCPAGYQCEVTNSGSSFACCRTV